MGTFKVVLIRVLTTEDQDVLQAHGKVIMENVNQISQCQTLWARNKYLVLSHSSKIYLEIRQYLKSDSVEAAHVQDLIDQAVTLP